MKGQSQAVDPASIRLFRDPPWATRLTIENDRSYPKVKVVLAAPLSWKSLHISLLDCKDEEIALIGDPRLLDEQSRRVIDEEIAGRYLHSRVNRIHSLRSEFGTSYWDVDTDRGRREFVVQNLQDNVSWLGDHRLLIADVDGNRFEVPDTRGLDERSMSLLDRLL